MKVLIIGGYGVFGGRLVDLISDVEMLDIIVSGRTGAKAEAFCKARPDTAATLIPIEFDRADIVAGLSDQQPDIVVDASGPFQIYSNENSGDPYIVIRACLAAGVHYIDLADGRDFVMSISQFDKAAKKVGVTILSGVSTCPVLTFAAMRDLGRDMNIKSVRGGIAPSPHAGMGLNVMRSILSYAGSPMTLRRGGKDVTAKGLTETSRYTISPPGYMPLRNKHFSLVDIPDLELFPASLPNLETVWFGAGAVPESLHKLLNGLARLRAVLRLPSYVKFAPLFKAVLDRCSFGEHRGGMFVEVSGEVDEGTITRSWHLIAEGDDGPYIPSMASAALIKAWTVGRSPKIGARPATHELELADFEPFFAARSIHTGMREDSAAPRCVHEAVLGSAYLKLPNALQHLHGPDQPLCWRGKAQVERGTGFLSKIIALFIGFPNSTEETDVQVDFKITKNGEHWQRNFNGHTFSSFQSVGHGRHKHHVMERFGIITVALALAIEDERLKIIPRAWSCLGVPLPRFLLPQGDTFEHAADGVFNFDVTIKAPIIGHIVSYCGWLKPVE